MVLLYTFFASSVLLGGLVTVIGIIRTGYAESTSKSALQYTPEEEPLK
jgi:hypothetical protein